VTLVEKRHCLKSGQEEARMN